MVPVVVQLGYKAAPPNNATRSNFATSVVVSLAGKENVADNIAKDLQITRLMGPDGVVPESESVDGIDQSLWVFNV